MKPLKVVGLNSGTSMDGVDAALFSIHPLEPASARVQSGPPPLAIKMLGSHLHRFEPEFQKHLQELVCSKQSSLEDICRLNVALGEIFAAAARTLMENCGLSMKDVDLIGSHGQTIWHSPADKEFWGVNCRASLQLGEPSVIAERTGVPVVGDFRAADLAAGGQGAPVVAFADEVLFGSEGQATGVLNIGGIANITAIDSSGEAWLAFDTGPGNMVIDRAVNVLFGQDFDTGGAIAAQGNVSENWLADLLKHQYFQSAPPKTCGREDFGYTYADALIEESRRLGLSSHDCIATLTALTASAVVQAYRAYIAKETRLARLVLGGGGAENQTLVKLLSSTWPHAVQICRHEDFGFSTKFKEALLFALLAYTTYFGIPNNVPRCTGARRKVCLGKLCRP